MVWLFYERGAPQSNQRGIETAYGILSREDEDDRLNRTSVGLKLETRRKGAWRQREPQSNQRGIETNLDLPGGRPDPQASIEPAWD